jgi:DNA-binding FadR family transcriptional regulator
VVATGVLRVPNGAELIADHLRRQIVRGEIPKGSSLPPENRLRERYGVSGPTLRAAFRVLESEGLLSVRRGARGGAQVHRPQLSVATRYVGIVLHAKGVSLDDLQLARAALEPPLAGLAARRSTPESVKRLEQIVDTERQSLSDAAAFVRITTEFHREVVRQAGNETLTLLANVLWDLVERQVYAGATETGDSPARLKQRGIALEAHGQLTEHIAARDHEGAEAFWRKHMLRIARLMSEFFGKKALVDLFG